MSLCKNGKVIYMGTITACAKWLGVTVAAIDTHRCRHPGAPYRGYTLEFPDFLEAKSFSTGDLKAMKAWDAFCGPLRKEFGIPIHRRAKDG